ncbi:hypothetical protein ACFQ0B_61985 [Nonomuraea thailandensis]
MEYEGVMMRGRSHGWNLGHPRRRRRPLPPSPLASPLPRTQALVGRRLGRLGRLGLVVNQAR